MNQILHGDALTMLKTLPDESVHCCVTSPPYWGLRDYGVDGQLGLEKTPQEYVAKMVEVFREVRRVLRSDGTLWLNMGDSYNAAGRDGHGTRLGYKQGTNRASAQGHDWCRPTSDDLKPKDLVMMPARIALALQADGWFLRSQIPWLKRTAMPESVKDRPTTAIEYIYLLSKSVNYYYDHEAIKLQASPDTHARYARGRSDNHKWADGGPGNQTIARRFPDHDGKGDRVPGVSPKAQKPVSGWDNGPGDHRGLSGRYPKPKQNESFSAAVKDVVGTRARRNSDWFIESWQGLMLDEEGDPLAFVVNPKGFKEAHFATFPPGLVEPCILAGCPEGGTVLDPFSGAGTTGLVCSRLNRDYTGIELSGEYVEMSRRRIEGDAPLLNVGTDA
jgi:DNA modification methylase